MVESSAEAAAMFLLCWYNVTKEASVAEAQAGRWCRASKGLMLAVERPAEPADHAGCATNGGHSSAMVQAGCL